MCTRSTKHRSKKVEESLRLNALNKDQIIAPMQQKIDELKQKTKQGRHQLQGEVQEIALEITLPTNLFLTKLNLVPMVNLVETSSKKLSIPVVFLVVPFFG